MATLCDINGKKPTINYPTKWLYKVIIDKNDKIDEVLKDLKKEYKIAPSNTSKSGKYKSFNLSTLVLNEGERVAIFELLKTNEKIKYVL